MPFQIKSKLQATVHFANPSLNATCYWVQPSQMTELIAAMNAGAGVVEWAPTGSQYTDVINAPHVALVERQMIPDPSAAVVELWAVPGGDMFLVDPESNGATVHHVQYTNPKPGFAKSAFDLVYGVEESTTEQLESWYPAEQRPDDLVHVATWRADGASIVLHDDDDIRGQLWTLPNIRAFIGASIVDARLALTA